MSYRRVRSYRRRDARRYRGLADRQRSVRVPTTALLAVALAAGVALVSAPHVQAMFSASSRTAQVPAAAEAAAAHAAARPHAPGTLTKAEGLDACPVPAGAPSAAPTSCPAATPAPPPPPSANTDCEIIVPAHP